MNQPVFKEKFGTIEVVAFEKETEKYGKTLSFSVTKSYKVKDEWKRQTIYLNNVADFVNIIQCMQAALDFKFHKNVVNNPVADESDEENV